MTRGYGVDASFERSHLASIVEVAAPGAVVVAARSSPWFRRLWLLGIQARRAEHEPEYTDQREDQHERGGEYGQQLEVGRAAGRREGHDALHADERRDARRVHGAVRDVLATPARAVGHDD